MSTSDAIYGCPFCGYEAVASSIDEPSHPDCGGHFIQCTNSRCGASTNLRFACGDDPVPLLREQWNRRVASGVAPSLKPVAHVVWGRDGWPTFTSMDPAWFDSLMESGNTPLFAGPQVARAEPAEREAFRKWLAGSMYREERAAGMAWDAWQARARLAATQHEDEEPLWR